MGSEYFLPIRGLVILTVGAEFEVIAENATGSDVVTAPLSSVAFAVIV